MIGIDKNELSQGHIWNHSQKVEKMKSVVEYSPVMQNNNDPLLKDQITKRVSRKK